MQLLKKIHNVIHQDVPYRNDSKRIFLMLRYLYVLLIAYSVLDAVLEVAVSPVGLSWIPVFLLVLLVLGEGLTYCLKAAENVRVFFAVILLWIVLFVQRYGWNCGVQHFLFGLVALYFFATYRKAVTKALVVVLLFAIRLILFWNYQRMGAIVNLEFGGEAAFQVLNSAFTFLMLGLVCGYSSAGIASAEEKLILYNEELRKEATTDPLTGLLNRRTTMAMINMGIRQDDVFTVVLGDIDFFKRINDDYGHCSGDEVLVRLSALFQCKMKNSGAVCRWGGEEFLFYFPEKNGDEVAQIMEEILTEIRHMSFGTEKRFQLTMTFGVEENDFRSELHELLDRVDKKLYMGKEGGRNCIIY